MGQEFLSESSGCAALEILHQTRLISRGMTSGLSDVICCYYHYDCSAPDKKG